MSMPYDDAQNLAYRWITQYQYVTGTVGLYTHDDGNYSFIEVREDSVYAAGITFTATGIKLLEDYKAKWGGGSIKPAVVGDINQQLIEETYLMSQALYHSSWIKIADFANPVQGTTHKYGWHFNWDGSKAIIVTYVKHVRSGAVVHHEKQEYFLHEVTIHEDASGILTASLELLETADAYILNGELRIWSPANTGGQMQLNPIIFCNEATDYDLVEFDVPLYGFYKSDGSIRLIRFFRELSPAKTIDEAIDEAADINCPSRGWQTSGPDIIEGTYEGRTTTSTAGFKVDDITISATKGNGFYRKRTFSRAKTGTVLKNSRAGWHNLQISIWTQTDWETDCTIAYDCANSGPIFETEEIECIYDEEMSTTGGPNIGETIHQFALLIEGRSTDSVAMVSWQQTYKTMRTTHVEEIGHDSIQQVHRSGEAWNEECNIWENVGSTFGPKAQFIMPTGGCELSDSIIVAAPAGQTCRNEAAINESNTESSFFYDTNVYIANPYEVTHTHSIASSDYFAGGEYIPYLNPDICYDINPAENLWYDILSFSGRSIRKEKEDNDVENDGSNCEIPVDLPGGAGFWFGAT